MPTKPTIVVFDVGKVLLDWDPRYLYRKIFPDAQKMEWFLANVCTDAWNLEQDRGRTFADAVAVLSQQHPEYAAEIRAFDERWHETVPHAIDGTVTLLLKLQASGVPTYCITNFNQDKFRESRARFPFLNSFRGTIVSGEDRLLKPDARIYQLLLSRYGLNAADCFFIDDSPRNVDGARAVGMQSEVFTTPEQFAADLRRHGFAV